MSPRKEYFDEPLVKVDFQKARFPRTCPVCGTPATKVVRMNIAKAGKYPLRPSLDYLSPRRRGLQQSELKILTIQVCEDHAHPDAGTDRYQSLCIIVGGFLMVCVALSLMVIGDSISRSRPIPFWAFLYIGLLGIALLLSAVVFSPNALEKSVKIVGFDGGKQNILIAFKRSDYREEFMNENQMTAELVSWIMRSDD